MYEDGPGVINCFVTLNCRLGDIQLFSMLYAESKAQSALPNSPPSYVPAESSSDTKAPDVQEAEAYSPSTLSNGSNDMRTPEDLTLSSVEPIPTPESQGTDVRHEDATNPPAYYDVPPASRS